MSHYLATYDITIDRVRERVADLLLRYGVRIQASVFEVEIDIDDLPVLQAELGRMLSKTDTFDLVPIDMDPDRVRLSWQGHGQSDHAVIVVV